MMGEIELELGLPYTISTDLLCGKVNRQVSKVET
jgi:hypothetical protein